MSLITLVLKRIRGKKIFCFQSQKDRNPFNYDHANPHLSKAANYMSGGHPVIQKTCHYFPCHTLRHLSTHPNYPACNLKGFSRSVLDVLISRTHPLPFNRRGKRGNEWCRACQASWERHGRAIVHLTLLPRVGFIRAEAAGQSTPKLTGKDWEEPSMAAANPVSRFSSPAWVKGAFKVSLGEFSPTRPKMANPWRIAQLLRR